MSSKLAGHTAALANVPHLLGVILQSSGENLDLEKNVGAGPGSGANLASLAQQTCLASLAC